MSFESIEKEYYRKWFEEGLKDQALLMVEKAYKDYPEHHEQLLLDLIMLYGQLKQVDKCKSYFNHALDKGYWYPSPYLNDILFTHDYQEETVRWEELSKNLRKKPFIKVVKPINYKPTRAMPLVVSLHGWGEDLELFSKFWKSDLIDEDYVHLMVESSQQIGYKHFSWNDRERAFKDVEKAIKDLKGRYAIGDIIFTGFSQGATLAIDMAANSKLKNIKGFIALCPDLPESIKDQELELKGTIITGDLDHAYESQVKLKDYLGCDFEVVKDFGHWFPEDLSERLSRALRKIRNNS
ncbi:hypothetical protein EZV73_04275 [Acidaminobacter sp. JC074]|uniref:alpha/beta hydrolase n=1 Tax=Acidaminobacter sp. JC074 TaxID=2530199 RepID=UPI001F108992|nr:hypothetical protein [Acidaminobacter sp. JC074]MCH4886769.1 hypothetical protein [Acidaminobacter sp. JC074]